MDIDEGYTTIKDFRIGEDLPVLDGVCPLCGGKVIHFVNGKYSSYIQNCVSQAVTGKVCGWHRSKKIRVKAKR